MQRFELSNSLPYLAARPGSTRATLTLARAGLATMVSASLLSSAPALALQGGEDASTLPVLIEKQSGLGERIQLSAMFATTLATKWTDSVGAVIAGQYMFTDWIGVEAGGGFFGVNESETLGVVRAELAAQGGGSSPQLTDLAGIQWLATANVVVVPVYGKISFAAEWNPSFDFFLTAGGGVVGTSRERTNLAGSATETSVEPQFNFGGGLRFYLIKELALRFEARTYLFTDPASGEIITSRDPQNPNPTDITEEVGGLTTALFGQVGLQWNL